MKEDTSVLLPLEGRQITQLRYDYAFGMDFSDESGQFSIRINTVFTLTILGKSAEYNPEQTRECGPTLRLFNARVTSARAFTSGRLEITFSDDVTLEVDSNPQFEAWEGVGSNGLRLVAVPGGDLAIWRGSPSA